jgi:hypothetical protein
LDQKPQVSTCFDWPRLAAEIKTLADLYDSEGDRLMTLAEAGEYFGVSPDVLRVALNRGILKGEKRGRDWFVRPSQVMDWRS